MTRRFQRLPRTPQPRTLIAWGLGILLLGLAATAPALPPEYALSGQAPALEKSVLAQTTSGQVTALDVLMLDAMRDRAVATIPVKAWVNPGALESTPYRPGMKAAVDRLLAYESLARKVGDWEPAADELRVKSFGAAMAVWIENVVKPQVTVMDSDIDRYYLAHPEKYLRRLRAQVRYIFIATGSGGELSQSPGASTTSAAAKLEARNKLESVATQIASGKISFADAARKYSQAPSAAEGGLLPPFYNGTFFNEFDSQTFLLDKPGKISPVFEGPEGYYLVQLVRLWPPQNIPISEVREDIRYTLSLEHVRHYYAYEMAHLNRKHYIQNFWTMWNYLNLSAPIVAIDNVKLSRPDYLRFFGNPVDANYQVRPGDLAQGAGYWTDGEVIMQDLAARGLADHPWIQRARALAAATLKADHYYLAHVPAETYAASQAMDTIRNNKQFIQGMRSARVIAFEVHTKEQKAAAGGPSLTGAPNLEGATPQAETGEEGTIQETIAAQIANGVLPIEPSPVNLAEWFQKNSGNQAQLTSAIETLQQQIDNAPIPGVKIVIKDHGWVDVLPGTGWYDVLKGVSVGQFSEPVNIIGTTFVDLVVAERAIDLREWQSKPLLIRALAFQIEASMIFHGEVLRVRRGQVNYTFQ